jgi:predicted dehydrogenase
MFMAWASISEPKAPPGKRTEAASGVWGESLAVKENKTKIRYAVVGLGHIAQVAVVPAFAHASRNSALAALVSDDPKKLKQLSRLYGIGLTYSYEQYDDCLRSGEIDAVYIALPNSMHADYAVRAANAGVHVLCEKPMAVTEKECAVEVVRSGKLGEPRIFNSVFGMQVREGNIRTQAQLGGGTLYDLGIYCINAARYLFQDEPLEAFAWSATNADARFSEVDEMTSAVLRFPKDRLAVFTSSFGSADIASYQVIGTRGDLRVDRA